MNLLDKIYYSLPWVKNKSDIYELRYSIQLIEDILMEARIANFVRIEDYSCNSTIQYELPKPIKLEKLQNEIDELKSIIKSQTIKS
jgi:hypothetical protein